MQVVTVAVGVVQRNNTFFICKRAKHQHQGGKWEFPGGKIEQHETVSEALSRELMEEINIQVHATQPILLIEHDYGDKQVQLHVHLVSDFSGEAYGKEGQVSTWVPRDELATYDFPDANKAIINHITKNEFF